MKRIVIFGAGKVGRSFIGQLFGRSGYDVVFVDIDKNLVKALNEKNRYKLVIKKESGDDVIWVENVRGLLASDEKSVLNELTQADLAAISVGNAAIKKTLPLLAKGLLQRRRIRGEKSLDILIAENLRDSANQIREGLRPYLPENYPLKNLVGLVETSIGKMVPLMSKKDMTEDPLQIFAESYNTLIVDRKGFRNDIPQVEGIMAKENMKAWVDRKSFIHNLGHASVAYLGFVYNPDFVYLYQALEVPEIHKRARETMLESAKILMRKYQGEFTKEELTEHIDDLLHRFKNKALGDTIYRVGKDINRKLGPDDRLVGALRMGQHLMMPFDRILYVIICAMHFRATDEQGNIFEGDKQFAEDFKTGVSYMLTKVCRLNKTDFPFIHQKARQLEEEIRSTYQFIDH